MKIVQEQITSIEKMYYELEKTKKEDLFIGEDIKNISGNIKFEKVNFSYTGETENLKNLSFDILSGQKIALVGDTGIGKSTIFNLLLRFWDTSSGNIYIDGKNIKDISKKSLRDVLGVVSQDSSLFNMTIKENLLLVKEDATIDELETALKNAQADFVFKLKDGTIVESGTYQELIDKKGYFYELSNSSHMMLN